MKLRRMLRECHKRGEQLRLMAPPDGKPSDRDEAADREQWADEVTYWGERSSLLIKAAFSKVILQNYNKDVAYTADRRFLDTWLSRLERVLADADYLPLEPGFDASKYPEKPYFLSPQ
jgi:hypothetical protein